MLHGALSIRTSVTQRVFASNATRCILLLGARIIESFLDGTLTAKSSQYNDWIKRLEEQLGSSTENLTFNEAETRAIDTLQVRVPSKTPGTICIYTLSSSHFTKRE